MKIHLYSHIPEIGMPEQVFNQYQSEGYRGSACGYMRKNVTNDKSKVTCFYCKRQITTKEQVIGERK